ncbi:MAG: NUDIX hydrolase [Chromatiales bacterium]|jgi:8-oxo-dGTP diphosphatase|nr:NUDIX hydrolase [Chromatiales bacterium]
MNAPNPNKIREITRVAAYGLARKDTSILLCRLSSPLRSAGRWTLPGGGLEFGEDPEAGVIREFLEETSLTVRVTNLAGVDSRLVQFDGKMMHSIRIIYRVEVVGGTLANELDGTTDLCQWWDQHEVNQLPLVDLAQVGLSLAFDKLNDRVVSAK